MTTTENGQRDELARDIFIADNSAHPNAGAEWDAFEDIGGVCGGDYAYDIADGLIAAGYRKPRTVTTSEGLDALPDGSAILDGSGDVGQKLSGWWYFPETASMGSSKVLKYSSTVTVIHEPGAEVGA